MKKTVNTFSQILNQELPDLKKQFHIASLELFGSYVRGEQDTNSDLDILVTFSNSPTMFEFIKLENHLSELLGVKVDLVMRSALKPNIGKHILSEARPI